MKNGIGVILGIIALFVFGARVMMMNNSVENNKYQKELAREIQYHSTTNQKSNEIIGEGKGVELLKGSDRQREQVVAQKKSSTNQITSEKPSVKKENTAMSIDSWVQEKLSPMTERSTLLSFDEKTNEVYLVFATIFPNGKKLVGSSYQIGTMEKKKNQNYFKPVKWKKDHKGSNSFNEYSIIDISYIDPKGKRKTGNLKAYWDWGANGKFPYFFEEE